jgi:hypothetical protein
MRMARQLYPRKLSIRGSGCSSRQIPEGPPPAAPSARGSALAQDEQEADEGRRVDDLVDARLDVGAGPPHELEALVLVRFRLALL